MWAKKLDEVARTPKHHLWYKGLAFAPYYGILTNEQAQTGRMFYAYYGSQALTEAQIEREVDGLIDRGLVPA
jgi:hypothetical protein